MALDFFAGCVGGKHLIMFKSMKPCYNVSQQLCLRPSLSVHDLTGKKYKICKRVKFDIESCKSDTINKEYFLFSKDKRETYNEESVMASFHFSYGNMRKAFLINNKKFLNFAYRSYNTTREQK